MNKDIVPVTEGQARFVEMCEGKCHPETEFEHLWKKYQLDIMYDIAKACEYHIGIRFSYYEISAMFKKLASQGHQKALTWSSSWKLSPDHKPPLINLRASRPEKRFESSDIFDVYRRFPGNAGSRR